MSLFNLLTQHILRSYTEQAVGAGSFPLIRDSIFSHCLGPLYQIIITLSSLFLLYLLFFALLSSMSLVAIVHCILLPLTAYQPVMWISLFSCFTNSAPCSSLSSANSLALSGLTLCPSSDPLHAVVPLLHVSISS